MAQQKIKIHSIEEKTGKNNAKYFLVKTDKGTMSCFPDYEGLEDLKTAFVKGEEIEVNVEKSGDFLNIRKEKANGQTKVSTERASVKGSPYEKDPVGLAIEIYNGFEYQGPEKEHARNLMSLSIDLVKQAREAF